MGQQYTKYLGLILIFTTVTVSLLSYQNCAPDRSLLYVPSATHPTTTAVPTPTVTPYSPPTTITPIVSGTPIAASLLIRPDSDVAFKISKPAAMTTPSDYYWIVVNHNNRLVVSYGNIVLDSSGNYILLNITTRSRYTNTESLKINFYNKSSKTYLTEYYSFTIAQGVTQSTDYMTELCNAADKSTMSFWVDRTTVRVINFFDIGSGISTVRCRLGAGSSQQTIDCFDGSAWPTNWKTQAIEVTAWNRCGQSSTSTFQP